MAHCKGIAVIARLKWVRRFHGDAGARRLHDALSAPTRDALERHILPHDWVPMRTFVEVNVAVDRLFGSGDLRLCKDLGAWAAQENLPRLFRLFYRLGTPGFMFERAAKLWSAHYDSGRLTLVLPTEKRAHLSLFDFAEPHRAHCLSVLGWAAKSVELSGARVVESDEARCRTRGDDRCEFVVSWA
ncbi:MAG: hypothetical protein INH37_06700 [Myxococcaceae bacterium]|nr:hypothetical protein [Myxococcaceae bacterium]